MKKNAKDKKSYNYKLRIVLFSVLMASLLLSLFFASPIEKFLNYKYAGSDVVESLDKNSFKAHFIDVGQGDCIAIEFPTGEHMLIDSGDKIDAYNENMLNYLNSVVFTLGEEKKFDYFVLTHTDKDHVGGAVKILDNFEVGKMLLPDVPSPTKTYTQVLNKIDEKKINKDFNIAGLVLNVGKCKISFFSPYYNSVTNAIANNQSPIMIFEYCGKKLMLTGDARQDLEKDMLKKEKDNLDYLDVDVLKVAHHGSETSSSMEFLLVVKPEFAVVSVGQGNRFDHPRQETLSRLKEIGVKDSSLYRTDINGNVAMAINDDSTIVFKLGKNNFVVYYIQWEYVVVVALIFGAIVIFVPFKKLKKMKHPIK